MIGYDTLFFTGDDDWQMIIQALNEDRVILTKDTEIMRRGVVVSGRIKAVLIKSDNPEQQIKQVIDTFTLNTGENLFSICLECNRVLEERTPQQVERRVPKYVFQTQDYFLECPYCHRIYWRGTHWEAMTRKLAKFK